jgi:flavin reductase (DIM6/NTAB) family NADH-FMN oxidoreductase RutF
MFYQTEKNDHGLPHDPIPSLVVPRPIGWISTLGKSGVVNVAPYSFFNLIGTRPYLVMFSSTGRKDTQRNAEETGEFVLNMATYKQKEAVNQSSASFDPEISEATSLDLAMAPSKIVRPPRIAGAPAAMECKYLQTIQVAGLDGRAHRSQMVIGQIVGVYIADDALVAGLVDIETIRPLSRMGYMDYTAVDSIFPMPRPAVKPHV